MSQSHRAGPWRRWRSTLAALLATLLAAGALTTLTSTAATAAAGTLTDLSITVTDDGTASASLGIDNSPTNGLIATNNTATMTWSLSGEGLTDAVLTQTLPEGWTWVTSSLNKLVSDSAVYKSSYTLSSDQRTVTATISLPSNALVSITGLQAKVGYTPTNGSTYTPELVATDSVGDHTADAGTLTVVSTPQIMFYGGSSTLTTPTTHDFGSGEQKASRLFSYLTYTSRSSTVGQDVSAQLDLPHTFTMTYDGPVAADVTLCLYDSSGWLTLDSVNGQTVTLTLHAQPGISDSSFYAALCRWYPADTIPQSKDTAVTVTTTTTQPDLDLADGSVLRPAGSSSSSAGVYYEEPVDPDDELVPASATGAVGYYNWKSGMAEPTLPIANTTNVTNWYAPSSNAGLGTGAHFATKSEYTPQSYSQSKTVEPTTNLVGYQFWDANLARITEHESDIWVGSGSGTSTGKALDPSAYTLQFSPNQSTDGPWYDSIEAAGGAAAVQGVRMALTDTWGEGASANYLSVLRLIVPRTVVWDQIQSVWLFVNTQWTSDQHAPLSKNVSVMLCAIFGGQSLTSTPSQLVSGNLITYRVGAGMYLSSGTPPQTEPLTVHPGTTTVRLPANITAVDYQDAIDQGWSVASYTPADWGPDGLPGTNDDVHGPIIEFVWPHDLSVGSTWTSVPTFSIVATTSLQAPTRNAGQVTASAVTDFSTDTRGTTSMSAAATNTMLQVDTLTMDGAVAVPVIQPTDDTVQWDTNWYNFGKDSKSGAGYILDVLPYNGDGRGTDTTGTLALRSVTALGDATRGTLEFTTTAPDQIGAHGENADWQPIADGTDLSGATAVRLGLNGLNAGAVGSIRMVLGITGQTGGDVLVNSGSGWIGDSVTLNSGNYQIRVAQSVIEGTVWNDTDGDGTRADDEPGIADVRVTLTAADDTTVETTTDANGGYRFAGLSAGDYRVEIDRTSFSDTMRQTAGPAGSAIDLTLLSDQTRSGLDFGYTAANTALTVTATGTAPDPVVADGVATLVYTVTNSGGSDLTGVTVTDTLDPDRATGTWSWPGDEGALAVDQSATYTVSYPVDQTEIDAGQLTTTVSATGDFEGLTVTADPVDVTVLLGAAGAVSLDVTGVLGGTVALGQPVNWTATVTNTGGLTLTDLGLTASGVTWTGLPTDLAPGASATVTGSSALTQADLDAGVAAIRATATGDTPSGTPVSATTDGSVTFAVPAAINVDLTVNGSDSVIVTEDDQLAWSATITNTGAATLVGVSYADDGAGLTLPADFDGTLAPGDSVLLTGNGTALLGDHLVTATVSGTAGQGTSTVIAKASDTAGYTAEAASTGSISGRVWQDRAGSATRDAADPGISGVSVTLLTGDTVLAETVTDADGGYRFGDLTAGDYRVSVDRAGVHAGLAEPTIPAADQAQTTLAKGERAVLDFGYRFLDAALELTGQVTALTAEPVAGDQLDVLFTVTNTGETDLSGVDLSQDLPGAIAVSSWDGVDGDLPIGASAQVELRTVLTQQQIDASALTVTAQATGSNLAGDTAEDQTELAIDLPSASALTIAESGALDGSAIAGDTVTWTATLTNAGATTLTSATVAESGWDLGAGVQLDPGASVSTTAHTTLTQAEVDAGATSSTVTGRAATLAGASVTATASAEVALIGTTGLSLDLLLDGIAQPQAPGASVSTGQQLGWSYALTNTGAVTLTGLGVTDDLVGRGDLVLPAEFDGTLAPGASVTLTAGSAALTGQVSATATAAGTTAGGAAIDATATAWYSGATVTDPPVSTPRILAITGASLGGVAVLALLLIGVGVGLRRRRVTAPVER